MADHNTTVTENASDEACFGQWRASSVQEINAQEDQVVGRDYFSERKGENATINADNKEHCEDQGEEED